MYYKHLTLPIKQMLGYLVGILLLTVLFSVSVVHFSTIVAEYNNSMKFAWRHLNALQDMRAFGLQVMIDIDQNVPKAKGDVDRLSNSFDVLLRGSSIGLPKDIMLIAKDMTLFREQTFKLIDLIEKKAAPAELAEQRAAYTHNYHLFMGRLYVEIEKSKSNVSITETIYLQRVSYLLLLNIILAPLSFAFLYIYGYFLSNYMGLRLLKFMESMRKILAGNYKEKIDDTSKDEIGQIAQGINELAERLDKNK
ncbi:MAG: HAMP domain-containing protein [Candidatus Margulisiibacteriota bacterium]